MCVCLTRERINLQSQLNKKRDCISQCLNFFLFLFNSIRSLLNNRQSIFNEWQCFCRLYCDGNCEITIDISMNNGVIVTVFFRRISFFHFFPLPRLFISVFDYFDMNLCSIFFKYYFSIFIVCFRFCYFLYLVKYEDLANVVFQFARKNKEKKTCRIRFFFN